MPSSFKVTLSLVGKRLKIIMGGAIRPAMHRMMTRAPVRVDKPKTPNATALRRLRMGQHLIIGCMTWMVHVRGFVSCVILGVEGISGFFMCVLLS